MALQDFIQALQEQDTVYSTPPQPSIRVIPPENQCIKIIPPESAVLDPAPKVIKLKIKQKPVEQAPVQPQVQRPQVQSQVQQPQPQVAEPILQKPKLQPVSKPQEQPQPKLQPVSKPVQQTVQLDVNHSTVQVQQTQNVIPKYTLPDDDEISSVLQSDIPPQEPRELTADDIFNSTGTEYSKKGLWMEYFEKAKSSRKSNPIVDRMKVGRFTITPDNKVLLLPDYDIVGKDPDDVLKDKWF